LGFSVEIEGATLKAHNFSFQTSNKVPKSYFVMAKKRARDADGQPASAEDARDNMDEDDSSDDDVSERPKSIIMPPGR
jgi:hypothetical protein